MLAETGLGPTTALSWSVHENEDIVVVGTIALGASRELTSGSRDITLYPCGLTSELSCTRRDDALAARCNMNQGASRPGWHAVACQLERDVRPDGRSHDACTPRRQTSWGTSRGPRECAPRTIRLAREVLATQSHHVGAETARATGCRPGRETLKADLVFTAGPNVRVKLPAEADGAGPRKDNAHSPWSGPAAAAVAGQLERMVRRHSLLPVRVA